MTHYQPLYQQRLQLGFEINFEFVWEKNASQSTADIARELDK